MRYHMRFKGVFAVLLAVAVLLTAAFAEGDPKVDLAAMFHSMSIEELKQAKEVLETELNAKIVENAVLSFDTPELTLGKGKNQKLTLIADGREITAKTKVVIESDKPEIARVQNNIVAGVEAGEVTLTATATFEDGGVLTATCKVNVVVPVANIQATAQKVDLLVGAEADLKDFVNVMPADATNQELIFECADDTVLQLASDGKATGMKAGTVKVTVKTADTSTVQKQLMLNVAVGQPVQSLTLAETSFNVGKQQTHKLEATVGPEDATNQKLKWTVEDPKVASVSATGIVTGVKTGQTKIFCETTDGTNLRAEAKVEVITGVSAIQIKTQKIGINEGQTAKIDFTVMPADATNPQLSWKSSNSSIARVDSNGRVTGVSKGNCTITATAKDGSGRTNSVTVYVEPANPVYAEYIEWQTTLGLKTGEVRFKFKNECEFLRIKSLRCEIVCRSSWGYSDSSTRECDVVINPGKSTKSKYKRLTGFTSARSVELTVTSVVYSDGTRYKIPEEARYTSNFSVN